MLDYFSLKGKSYEVELFAMVMRKQPQDGDRSASIPAIAGNFCRYVRCSVRIVRSLREDFTVLLNFKINSRRLC